MSGLLCLQGGREFTSGCREMDAGVLERVGDGLIAVLAGAARAGDDYAGASDRARRHYAALGAEVVVVPDPRADAAAAVAALVDDVSLIVLPGGSPSSLRKVLSGEIETQIRRLYSQGTAVSGASAGAMVLCERMVRPDGLTGAAVVDGLGLVPGMALPHWTPGSDRNWPIAADIHLWGLPECGGVVLETERDVYAVGEGDPSQRTDGDWTIVPRR